MEKGLFSHKDNFPERIPGLEKLYDEVWQDDENEDYLYPIFTMLSKMPCNYHYTEETFIKSCGEKRIYKVRDLRTDRIVALARPVDGSSKEQK